MARRLLERSRVWLQVEFDIARVAYSSIPKVLESVYGPSCFWFYLCLWSGWRRELNVPRHDAADLQLSGGVFQCIRYTFQSLLFCIRVSVKELAYDHCNTTPLGTEAVITVTTWSGSPSAVSKCPQVPLTSDWTGWSLSSSLCIAKRLLSQLNCAFSTSRYKPRSTSVLLPYWELPLSWQTMTHALSRYMPRDLNAYNQVMPVQSTG